MTLDRFLEAQTRAYPAALAELRAGRKRTHWIWFIFPQIHGLGSSPTAVLYAIASLDEAIAYLAHPILGERLRTCTAIVTALPNPSLDHIFGFPDNLKFHSSITLFAHAAGPAPDPQNAVFQQALDLFFAGRPDPATIDRIKP